MRRSSMLLAPMALLFALVLAACGNKGPLVYAPAPDDEHVEEVEESGEPEAIDDAGTSEDGDPADAEALPPGDAPVDPPPAGDDNG